MPVRTSRLRHPCTAPLLPAESARRATTRSSHFSGSASVMVSEVSWPNPSRRPSGAWDATPASVFSYQEKVSWPRHSCSTGPSTSCGISSAGRRSRPAMRTTTRRGSRRQRRRRVPRAHPCARPLPRSVRASKPIPEIIATWPHCYPSDIPKPRDGSADPARLLGQNRVLGSQI